MLTCVYHPIDSPRVLEEDEAEKLIASGFWFDCPKKAQDYRAQVEDDIKQRKADEARKSLKASASSTKGAKQ
jgi:uncharacterized Rossmann fold enzyme